MEGSGWCLHAPCQGAIIQSLVRLMPETSDMISMYAQQPSARWKIAGKKPKDKYATSEKMLGDETL